MAITATTAMYALAVAAVRRCLANGTHLDGYEKQVVLDCLLDGTQEIAGVTDIAEDNVRDGRET